MAGYDLKRFEPQGKPPAGYPHPGGWTDDHVYARWVYEKQLAMMRESWRKRMNRESRVKTHFFGGRLRYVKDERDQYHAMRQDTERAWLRQAPQKWARTVA